MLEASRDSRELDFYFRTISVVKKCKWSRGILSKKSISSNSPVSLLAINRLAKETEGSGYENIRSAVPPSPFDRLFA